MTLLCEITDDYAKLPYLGALLTSKREPIPAIFGHELYRFLYKYHKENTNPDQVIKFIDIVDPNNDENKKLFKEKLKDYSPLMEACKSPNKYGHWVPKPDLTKDDELRIKIIRTIRTAKFVNVKTLKENNYLCYLPLCTDIIYEHFENNSSNYKVWSNLKVAQQGEDRLIELELSKVKDIYKTIKNLRSEHTQIYNKEASQTQSFIPPKYLENFRDTYLEELKQNRILRRKKEFHFCGSDDHSAREGVKHFLGYRNRMECDAKRLHGYLSDKEDALVIWNLHHEVTMERQNEVEKYIKDIDPKGYLVIQGNNLSLVSFFDKFKKIHVPDEEEIRELISGIFVSLIYHEMIYNDDEGDLYPIVKYKLLNTLLAENSNPQALALSICTLEKITRKDLLENVSFWYLLKLRYQEFYEDILAKKSLPPEKEIWSFEFEEDDYIVDTPSEQIGPVKVELFVIYLMIIVLHLEIDTGGATFSDIKKALYVYEDLSPNVDTDVESVRSTMAEVFKTATKKYKWFEVFFKRFMYYKGKKYIIRHNLVDVNLKNFKLSTDIFEKIKPN